MIGCVFQALILRKHSDKKVYHVDKLKHIGI